LGSGEQSNIRVLPLLEKPSLTLHSAAPHAVMNGKYLEEVIEERDLRIIIQSDLKCSKQCLKAVSMANKVLGMIKRTFSIRHKEIILQLYKSLVRPHLEYTIQAWRPHYQKDIDFVCLFIHP